MAQALKTIGGRVSGVNRFATVIVQNTLTAEPYATATGGISVDLATMLSQNFVGSNPTRVIDPADVIEIWGYTTDGYKIVATYVSGTTWTIRLYTSGASEIADGNLTKTCKLHLCVAQ